MVCKFKLCMPFHDKLPSRLQRIEDRLKEDTEREIRTLRDGLRLLNNQLEKVGVKLSKNASLKTFNGVN